MTDRPIHLFVHVPKTGGQTLRNHFSEQLGHGTGFVHLGPWGDEDRESRGLPSLEEFAPDQLEQVRCVLGHRVDRSTADLFAGRPLRWAAFLRRPDARLASLYNFEMGRRLRRGEPIEEFSIFARERRADQQTAFLARNLGIGGSLRERFDQLTEILPGFWCVGALEMMDDMMPGMFEDMGLPTRLPERRNRSGLEHDRLIDADDPRVGEFASDDVLDRQLHDLALGLSSRWVRRSKKVMS